MEKSISPQDTRIGWIGTGVMGQAMAGHVLDAAYTLAVHNRTPSKAEPLVQRGACWKNSPQEVAASSDIVISMVGFPPDVREVYLSDQGILAGARAGGVAIDMTTTEPSLAVEIYERARKRDVATIDAPVSGGDVGARNATLSIMVGGDREVFERVKPLLQLLGKQIVYEGGPGCGQHTKMCNQIVIASTMVGVCESLLYGQRAGLDLETMLSAIAGGAAGCWTLANLAPRILKRNFDPGFFVEHFIKDMGIALTESRRMKLELPGLELAHRLYTALQESGHGRLGTHALMLALEKLNDSPD